MIYVYDNGRDYSDETCTLRMPMSEAARTIVVGDRVTMPRVLMADSGICGSLELTSNDESGVAWLRHFLLKKASESEFPSDVYVVRAKQCADAAAADARLGTKVPS